MPETQRDLARITLGVIFIGGLIVSSLWIINPFLPAIIWATMIVVATWPVLLTLEARLGGRRSLAVTGLTLALLLLFFVPFSLGVAAIAENADVIVGWIKSLGTLQLPPPPEWVQRLPFFGEKIAAVWADTAAAGPEGLGTRIAPYLGSVAKWFAGQVGGVGLVMLEFLLTVLIAALMYASGESVADWLLRFGRRLAGDRGTEAVRLAGQAIRGVALGVVVTALVQSGLGGIGLAISGMPFAAVLTALMFVLCLAQIGAGPVLIASIVWLYWQGDTFWGTVLLIWSIPVMTLDNVLRPILIKRGANLPLVLVFAGVIGGLMAFGLVGIFVGPVVLAVAYTLLDEWVREEGRPAAE
jgi:predicted PurR-regulated permease PerM